MCSAVIPSSGMSCPRPAKGRTMGNAPLCGIHLRAEEQRGGEVRDL